LINFDVRNEKEVQQAVSEAVAAFGRIDVAVNNTGYAQQNNSRADQGTRRGRGGSG
jgi:NAD(P)-dependent dehydrogenase (short-subunit alcohol dehydrogenase family)